jgi:hypothetical protein
MSEMTPQKLVNLLATNELRIRTGILEVPVEALGSENNIAVALGVGFRDICAWKVSRTPSDREHLAITWQSIIEDLVSSVTDISLPGFCIWVSGVDVLLAAIPFEDRKQFWSFIRTTFRHSRGLILSVPRMAAHLFPEDERAQWINYCRLSVWTKGASLGN